MIRNTQSTDLEDILRINAEAFGSQIEPDLVQSLLQDDSAKPLFSLLALREDKPVGHVLFTKVRITGHLDSVSAVILAPLAVLPEAQRTGVGGELVRAGIQQLIAAGVELVFVLGHASYYPKFGFQPAGVQGFDMPYERLNKHSESWMVLELKSGLLGHISGKVLCADALSDPALWGP